MLGYSVMAIYNSICITRENTSGDVHINPDKCANRVFAPKTHQMFSPLTIICVSFLASILKRFLTHKSIKSKVKDEHITVVTCAFSKRSVSPSLPARLDGVLKFIFTPLWYGRKAKPEKENAFVNLSGLVQTGPES